MYHLDPHTPHTSLLLTPPHTSSHPHRYVVYRGSAVSYRAVKLHPSTDYTFRIAASSESGQGEWSDHVTFYTTPTPPHPPTGIGLQVCILIVSYESIDVSSHFPFLLPLHLSDVILRQTSNDVMVMSWQPVDHPMTYEVQVRTTSPGQEFQQVRTFVVCRLEPCELNGILLLDFTLPEMYASLH